MCMVVTPRPLRLRFLKSARNKLKMKPAEPKPNCNLSTSWPTRHPHSYAKMLQMCTLGHRSSTVQSFFTAVHPQIFVLLETTLELSPLKRWSPDYTSNTSDYFTSEVNHALETEREMWQLQNECGFLQLTFDPRTGERIHVALNDRQAQLLGLPPDDLISRFTAYDEPLLFSPPDLLLLIANDALRGFADGLRHIRAFLSETRLPALVCVLTLRSHDAAGRLLAVRVCQRGRHFA
jgi:hypothetical protein